MSSIHPVLQFSVVSSASSCCKDIFRSQKTLIALTCTGRSCIDCPRESRPPIRARSSSLKYPVLSWKKSAATHHTQKKTPWSLHQQVVYRRCHQPSGKKKKKEPCKAPSSSRAAVLVDGTRKGWLDAQHVVPDDLTRHEIDNLFDECWVASCSQHPAWIWRAVLHSRRCVAKLRTTGLRPLHTRRS